MPQKYVANDFSVQPLCSLCLCGYYFAAKLTTEAQRTQRLHREIISNVLLRQSPMLTIVKLREPAQTGMSVLLYIEHQMNETDNLG
jgi:hypothetical protein